jgi:hypothetical protein
MGREHRRGTSRITTQPVVDKFTPIDGARADLRSQSRLYSPHLASTALGSPHHLGPYATAGADVQKEQDRCSHVRWEFDG